jgi:hypothetical protein
MPVQLVFQIMIQVTELSQKGLPNAKLKDVPQPLSGILHTPLIDIVDHIP